MKCINCFHVKTKVTNSRPNQKPVVWRRRNCPRCKTVFTTYERPSLDERQILDHQGAKSSFNLGRLIISISKSFHHNPSQAKIDSLFLAETVETKLIMHGKDLSVDDISAITHETIKQYDPVAAIQYAAQHDLVILKRRPGRPSISYES